LLLMAGVGVLFAVLKNTKQAAQPLPVTPTAVSAPEKPAVPVEAVAANTPATPPVSVPTPPPAAPTLPPAETAATGEKSAVEAGAVAGGGRYTVRKHVLPATGYRPLGGAAAKKDGGTYELEMRFADFGAGIDQLTLANHLEEVLRPEPHVVQKSQVLVNDLEGRIRLAAFSAKGVEINGYEVGLGLDRSDKDHTYWREVDAGKFEATIEDQTGEPALRIDRVFELSPGSYEFRVRQKLTNLSKIPLTVVFHEIGPIDQPQGIIRYGGDPRNVRFGFVEDTKDDPSQTILSNDGSAALVTRMTALGSPGPSGAYAVKPLWPNTASLREQYTLVWAATTSRYFTVAAHHVADGAAGSLNGGAVAFDVARVDRIAIPTGRPPGVQGDGPFATLGLEFVSTARKIEPGATADLSLSAYAGPSSRKYIAAEPEAARMGLAEVVIYTFGGPCAFCTFQSITHLLRGFLGFLHDHILFDWALAIIVLVLCVRTILHPVTRWSQINMLRFSKQLQKLAPKQKAIQEKYGNDKMKMREEMSRLMREEGVGIGAGAMGCLPAFLQTPIWVALSATLYFAFELRHQPAFFGLFQTISGGQWSFFADLAEPDHFLRLGRSIHVWGLSSLMGPIDGLNIMPLLLGVVFYIQQKYLAPPTSATMTPEQEQQQKIMKIMTVVLFPLMMYNAPSGLALYFFMNSALAIVESRHIRKLAEPKLQAEQDRAAAGGSTSMWDRRNGKSKGKGKGEAKAKPGFFERMQQLAAEKQKMMDEAKRVQAKRDKGKR